MPPSKEISQNETANLISKKAMVVVAHADDAEYGCSGTIAKLCSQKWDVTYVLCTNGSKGSSDKNEHVINSTSEKNISKSDENDLDDEIPF